ncbi:hypothetical protein OF83DRAFT_1160386 [Amylostereum chailletii]|nr:hypothetical protein OF83DRAFT_1160386 [Amylostereum chailletii]
MEVLVTALIALLVQGFYVVEIYRLSRKNTILAGCVGLVVLGQLVIAACFSGKAIQYEFYTGLYETKDLFIGVLAAFTGVSVAMTAIYWYLLQSQDRSQYRPNTKKAMNRTVALCLDSGVLTSLFALAALVAFIVHPKTFEYTPFLFCLGRLYTLSFLSMLNGTLPTNPKPTTSSSFGNGVYIDGVGPRANVHVMNPLTPTRGQNVSIHIDTVQYVDRDESDHITSMGYLDAKTPSDYETKERAGIAV